MAAWSEHPGHLGDCLRPRCHIAQAKSDSHHIEHPVTEGQPRAVGIHEPVEAFLLRLEHHRLAEVRTGQLGIPTGIAYGESEITTSRGQIQHPARAPSADDGCGARPPQEIHAATQCVICEVVAARDRRKRAANEVRVLLSVRFDGSGLRYRPDSGPKSKIPKSGNQILVLTRGLEPPRVTPCASETHASANSAT